MALAIAQYTPAVVDAPDSQEPMVFDFRGHAVRMQVVDKKLWFVRHEACAAFGLKNPSQATKNIPEDNLHQMEVTDSTGRQRLTPMISEQGLYLLAMRSDKPMALEFQNWLAGDVVPRLRTTGEYRMQPAARPAGMVAIADVALIVREAVGPIVAEFKGLIVDVRQEMADLRIETQGRLRAPGPEIETPLRLPVASQSPATAVAPVAPATVAGANHREPLVVMEVQPRPGLRFLNERYLSVQAYKFEFCGNRLPVAPQVFGKRATSRCMELGVDTKKLSDGGVGFKDKECYPLSIMHEVYAAYLQEARDLTLEHMEASRRGTAGGEPPVALAA